MRSKILLLRILIRAFSFLAAIVGRNVWMQYDVELPAAIVMRNVWMQYDVELDGL